MEGKTVMRKLLMLSLILGSSFALAAACPNLSTRGHPSAGVQKPGSKRGSPSTWRPATYRGLVVGKSRRGDMLRVLGKPDWSGPPGDQRNDDSNPEEWNEYHKGGEFRGKLTVIVHQRTGRILRIDLYPEKLGKEAAIKHFGGHFTVTRYDFDECLSDGESAPMYESPNGQFLSIEYRDRGIALAIDQPNEVHYISYVKGPIGARSSKCNKR